MQRLPRSVLVLVAAMAACGEGGSAMQPAASTADETSTGWTTGAATSAETSTGSTLTSSTTDDDETTAPVDSTGDEPSGTDESTSDDGSTGDTTSTTGDVDPPSGEFECECVAGCAATLVQGHEYDATPFVSGARLLTHDPVGGKTLLWDRTTRSPLFVAEGWLRAGLAGETFYLADASTMQWYDAGTATPLGETAAGITQGIASDGSYLWIGSPTGLQVIATDGSELWFEAGDFQWSIVRALPDSLHVFSYAFAQQSVLAIDLVDSEVDEYPFEGMFGGWFQDSARFWADVGEAYRLHETDGTSIVDGLGDLWLGAGDHVVIDSGVRSVAAPNQVLVELSSNARVSGTAILSIEESPRLVELAPALVETEVALPEEADVWNFAYDDGEWVVAGADNLIAEGTGEHYTLGRFTQVDASTSGRLVAASQFGRTHVWDVTPDCGVTKAGAFERAPTPMRVADGGGVLVETWWNDDGFGTTFRDLPGGAELAILPGGAPPLFTYVSDDASLFSRTWYEFNGPEFSRVETFPDFETWASFDVLMPLYVAPGGQHAVGAHDDGTPSGLKVSYVLGEAGLVSVLDGLAFGFLDDTHILLGHYEGQPCGPYFCEVFLGADIVELDGTVVQPSSVPEVPGFQRISATELLAGDPPAVFDAYSGEQLWSGSSALHVAALGADFVATSRGGDLVVQRWR